jgi:hypothetical protein
MATITKFTCEENENDSINVGSYVDKAGDYSASLVIELEDKTCASVFLSREDAKALINKLIEVL